jgi:hypothetical protein
MGMSGKDDDDFAQDRERKQRERDEAREKAMWAAAAAEQRELQRDDEDFLRELKRILGDAADMTDAQIDRAAKRVGKNDAQIKRAKNAIKQQRKQKKSSGCVVLIGASSTVFYAGYEIVSRLL